MFQMCDIYHVENVFSLLVDGTCDNLMCMFETNKGI